MVYKWEEKYTPDVFSKMEKLCQELNISESVSRLLVQRGISDFKQAKDFFCPDLNKLHSPFLMKDMDEATDLILEKIKNGDKILIYGDYDTDGVTSVSMLYLFFKKYVTENICTYIPDRFDEGYGVSKNGIDFAKNHDCSLIITVDCGINSTEEIEYARENNIDFIITDHHEPKEKSPEANCILNPKQKHCNYPFKELSGCGVAFKLIQAICNKINIDDKIAHYFLDFVGVSISGDMVSVLGENRILLYHGLKKLNENPNIGFIPFVEDLRFPITSHDIVFGISPKINSSGRIKNAKYSFNILVEQNLDIARKKMEEIKEFNNLRKELNDSVKEEVEKKIIADNEQNNFSIVAYDRDWNRGVLGIVASRLVDKYYKPTIVFGRSKDELLVGSARTVKDLNILEIISNCSEYVEKFGGHRCAAGLVLKEKNYTDFKNKFELEIKRQMNGKNLTPTITFDMEISLSQITSNFLNILERMEPFGPGNMTPIFNMKNINLPQEIFYTGKKKDHIKFNLCNFDVIGFGLAGLYGTVKDENNSILFSLSRGTINSKNEIQMKIRDIK